MPGMDIGIDLGTTTVEIYMSGKGVVLKEPSVVAINTKTDEVLAVGEEAYRMLGRTPSYINAIRPLKDGVISDHQMTEFMIKDFLKKVCGSLMIKPRVSICVPSAITDVESRAVTQAAVSAGARKVYLIEEPIAAAIGSGIDITKPNGQMVVDIGGGTTDVAVISLNGVVVSRSLKVAGNHFDEEIIRHLLNTYKVLIGERMAEKIKIEIGCVYDPDESVTAEIKGRHQLKGLPQRLTVTQTELFEPLHAQAMKIVEVIKSVLDVTPPELGGDIYTNGIVLTGGGSLIQGLPELIESETRVKVRRSEDPINCVAIGTGRSFEYLEDLQQGFSDMVTYSHE